MRKRNHALAIALLSLGCAFALPHKAWGAERSAQVKEEPAQRAGDMEQSALPPKLTSQSSAQPTIKVYRQMVDGVVSFTDRPPIKGAYVVLSASCFACSLDSTIDWKGIRLFKDAYASAIEGAAQQYGLDPALVRAVIHAESGFNPSARSKKGATGLMQLMPQTARMLGVTDSLHPEHNIRGGTQYLASLLTQFQGDVRLATAAYNAGPGAVMKYAGIPPFDETRVYVQRVQILHRRYKEAARG